MCVSPCERGDLAAGQIYNSYQSSSSLMKCLDGAFCKKGSEGSSPMTIMQRVKALRVYRSVCPDLLLMRKLTFGVGLEANL